MEYITLGFMVGITFVMLVDSFTILKDVTKLNDKMEKK
jgi:hypothetical protein